MYPILASLGPVTLFGHVFGPLHFYSYGLCLALALGVSITLFARDAGNHIAPKLGQTFEQGFQKTFDLGMWVIICSILGARLFYVIENNNEFSGKFIDNYFVWQPLNFVNLTFPVFGPWKQAFFIWQGGLVFYGGLFGAIIAATIWFQSEKWPFAYSFDLVAPYILLGHAFGRVGCFLNGCCYGLVDHVHGLVFPGAPDAQPHLPTQLWELYGDLALFFLLLWARKWTIKYPWLTFSLYGLTYGTLRLVIEFWRRDWDKRYLIIFNSASQAVSGLIILVSVAMILWIFSRRRKIPSQGVN